MPRFKMLGVLAGCVTVLALSASPASAKWVSNSGQTTGTISAQKAGEFIYSPGAPLFKCNAAEIKAQWQIQGAGQIKQQLKLATEGPHLQVQIKKWGACSPAEVSECNFRLAQQESPFTATVGVAIQACLIKIDGCEMQIPIGFEEGQGSGKGINVGLKAVALENSGSNQIDKVNISEGGTGQLPGTGIFASASGIICSLLGLPASSEEGSWTGAEFTAEGVKAA